MKKILYFVSIFLMAFSVRSYADLLRTPEGLPQALPSADYGGVERSTVAFSSANVLCFSGQGSVFGFIASSGSTMQGYVMFRDTGALISGAVSGGNSAGDDYNTNFEFSRVYLSTAAILTSVAQFGSNQLGTYFKFPAPIRVKNGLAAKVDSALLNMVTILYTKFK